MPRVRSGKVTVTIDLKPEVLHWLGLEAERTGLSRSGVARVIVNEAFAAAQGGRHE